MVRFFLTAIISLFSLTVLGQYLLSGKVVDRDSLPLEFVSVELRDKTTLIGTALTDNQGKYQLTVVAPGTYTLFFSYVHFEKSEVQISIQGDTELNHRFTKVSGALKEVTVVSKKPLMERKVDRLVFNVENSLTAVGADGLEVLGKTPGVRVEDNGISLIGKSEVRVLMDGRLVPLSGDALASLLKSIPAESIASIEVITNPPAKYDAEGQSGLINIIKKKNRQLGYSGTIDMGYSRATYGNAMGGLNLNYNKSKTVLFGNLNLGKGAGAPYTATRVYFPSQTRKQISRRKEFSRYLRGSFGMEQQLTPKTSVGFSFNSLYSRPDVEELDEVSLYHTAGGLDSLLRTNATTDVLFTSQALNVHLTHKLDSTGKVLTMDADWFNNGFDRDHLFWNENYLQEGIPTSKPRSESLSDNFRETSAYTFNANLDLPTKKVLISTGFKLSFIRNQNNTALFQNQEGQFKPDPAYTNEFDYRESIQAVYGNASRRIDKWRFQAGLRAEYTQANGRSRNSSLKNNNRYFSVFPTFYTTYAPNEKNILSLNYGKRINRPVIQLLNPFRIYMSPYAYTEGNPDLKPSYSHNLELANTYNQLFNIALSYSLSLNQPLYLQQFLPSSNLQILHPENSLTSSRYMLSGTIFLRQLKWLESVNSLYGYYTYSTSTSPNTYPVVKGWGGNLATRNTIFFNKLRTVSGAVDFTYQLGETSGISAYQSYYSLDLAMRWSVMEKRLQISFNARDIFRTRVIRATQVVNHIEQWSEANNDSRRFVLNLRYAFGSSKVKAGRAYSGSQVEQGRAN